MGLRAMIMLCLAAGAAHAQSGDARALAEQLFNQARDLAKAGQWADACAKFEASLRYDPVLGTRLNLASCEEHIGKLATAWALYRESIDLAGRAGDLKRRDYARKQAAALEPRLARLAISAPASQPAGFGVTRDGTTIEAAALGVALYVDAGPHVIAASAPGFVTFTRTISLVEGKTEAVAIPELVAVPIASRTPASPAPAVQPAVAAPAPGVVASPAGSSPRTRTYLALGIGAVGVAAVGIGLGFGAKAGGRYDDAKALCGDRLVCGADNYARGQQLISDARSSATTSTVLVAAGAAVIVTGIVVLVTARPQRERATASVVPVRHDHGAGLAVVGSF